MNAGEVRNRGVELGGYVTPVKNANITWTVNANWYKNENKVISLFGALDNIVLASYQGGVTSNANVTWLKLCQFIVAARKLLKAA